MKGIAQAIDVGEIKIVMGWDLGNPTVSSTIIFHKETKRFYYVESGVYA